MDLKVVLDETTIREAIEWMERHVADPEPMHMRDPIIIMSPTEYRVAKEAGYINDANEIDWSKVYEDLHEYLKRHPL